jgi:hypothetical protein
MYRDFLMLNEAYVGKTPTLEEIEKKLAIVRPKIKYSAANNTLKEILEINRLFEKQFGMDVFALKIYPSDYPNAFTRVIATNFDIAENEILHNMVTADATNGYRFKEGNNFCIILNISSSLIADPKYTDAEIVAVLLHELGHNFADCIYGDIEFDNREMMISYKKMLIFYAILLSCTIIGIPKAITLLKQLKTYNNASTNKMEKRNQKVGKGKLSAWLASIGARGKDLAILSNEILNIIFGTGRIKTYKRMADISGIPDKAKKSLGRQNEVIADKFAGIYGYGPDQATALIKLENSPTKAVKIVNKLGEFGKRMNQKYDDAVRDMHKYDVHPQVIQRIYEEIKLLENELKKEDLDPKLKEVIQSQLDQLKQILEDATTVSKEMSKSQEAQNVYNKFINKECPDAVEQEIEDKIEQALDDVLNGKKSKKK